MVIVTGSHGIDLSSIKFSQVHPLISTPIYTNALQSNKSQKSCNPELDFFIFLKSLSHLKKGNQEVHMASRKDLSDNDCARQIPKTSAHKTENH